MVKKLKEKFILKLFKIINNSEYNSIICWDPDGKKIIIKDKNKLTKLIQSEENTKGFYSVHRQLNLYGFHKESIYKNEDIFRSEKFFKNQDIREIRKIKPKNVKQQLEEINNNDNVGDKIDGYLNLIQEIKNIINQNVLNDTLKFLVKRKEQRKNLNEEIQNLKTLCDKINSNSSSQNK